MAAAGHTAVITTDRQVHQLKGDSSSNWKQYTKEQGGHAMLITIFHIVTEL